MPTTCKIKRIKGDGELVVAAPHGEHDHHTGQMVEEICRKLGYAGVVVSDMVDPRTKKRVNVNRPTEGAGLEPEEEVPTEFAVATYHKYLSAVLKASENNFRFYVEIHGNEHEELERIIEVATYNVPQDVARRLSSRYKKVMKPEAMGSIALTDLFLADLGISMKVEGVTRIEKRAWANKLFGTMPLAQHSLHFELPMATRADVMVRSHYVTILSDLISFWHGAMTE